MEEVAKKKVKVIIIGNAGKISPTLMNRLQEHYDGDIELMSIEEYNASKLTKESLKEEKVQRVYLIEKPDMEHPYYLPKISPVEILNPSYIRRKTSKPYTPKTIGKVNSKKINTLQRCNNKRLKSR